MDGSSLLASLVFLLAPCPTTSDVDIKPSALLSGDPNSEAINSPGLHVLKSLLDTSDCTLFFIQSGNLDTTNFMSSASKALRDFYNFHMDFDKSEQRQLMDSALATKQKSSDCSIAFALIESVSEIENIVATIVKLRKTGMLVPDFGTDRFVFHVKSIQQAANLVHKSSHSSFTPAYNIRFGVILDTRGPTPEFYDLRGNQFSPVVSELNLLFKDNTKDLEGLPIRVSYPKTLNFRVSFSKRNIGRLKASGSYNEFCTILASQLNCTAIPVRSKSPGLYFPHNDTWTGAAGDLLNRRADMSIALIVGRVRSTALDFSFPLEYWAITFVTRAPQHTFPWHIMFQPFSPSVYALTLASALVLSIICSITRAVQMKDKNRFRKRGRTKAGKRWANIVISLTEFMWELGAVTQFMLGCFLLQSVKSTKYPRVFSSLWLLTVIVLSTAYISKLCLLMTFPSVEDIPDTFEDLAASDYKLTLWSADGYTYRFFQRGNMTAYANIFKRHLPDRNATRCVIKALHPRHACVLYNEMADFEMRVNLQKRQRRELRIASDKTFPLVSAIGFRKESLLKANVNRIVKPLVEGRIFERLVKCDMHRRRETRFGGSFTKTKMGHRWTADNAAALRNLVGSFYAVLGGWIVATVAFIFELYTGVYFVKHKRRISRLYK